MDKFSVTMFKDAFPVDPTKPWTVVFKNETLNNNIGLTYKRKRDAITAAEAYANVNNCSVFYK